MLQYLGDSVVVLQVKFLRMLLTVVVSQCEVGVVTPCVQTNLTDSWGRNENVELMLLLRGTVAYYCRKEGYILHYIHKGRVPPLKECNF